MIGFEKLVDIFIEFIGLFQIYTFVDEFEQGVILRCGRYHRSIKPGLRWLLPFGLERAIKENSKPAPLYLDLQSLHTKDGIIVNIQIGIIWRIADPFLFIIENEDTERMIGLLCSGIVSASVQSRDWDDLIGPDYTKTLKTPMNREAKRRGAVIDKVVVQDFASGKANRFWHEGIYLSMSQ